MPRSDNLYELPKDLPVPRDDGTCNHLPGHVPSFCPAALDGRAPRRSIEVSLAEPSSTVIRVRATRTESRPPAERDLGSQRLHPTILRLSGPLP